MKKACTVFLTILALTSCAKKMTKASQETEPFRNPGSISNDDNYAGYKTLNTSSNNQSLLNFSVDHEYIIPHFIETTKGSAQGQVTKIYFNYSKKDSKYEYFCRYLPSTDNVEFVFDNCFIDELNELQYDLNPSTTEVLNHNSGRRDDLYEGNSIIFEVVNTQNLDSINAKVQIETRPLY